VCFAALCELQYHSLTIDCNVVQYELAPGHVVNLLRVAGEPSVDLGVRQVASITFKQVAKRHWESSGGEKNLL